MRASGRERPPAQTARSSRCGLAALIQTKDRPSDRPLFVPALPARPTKRGQGWQTAKPLLSCWIMRFSAAEFCHDRYNFAFVQQTLPVHRRPDVLADALHISDRGSYGPPDLISPSSRDLPPSFEIGSARTSGVSSS